MINILVTGGAGYVGSHACKALAGHGFVPVTYDSLERGHAWAVKWGPLECGNLRDGERLRAVMSKYRPEAVLHFAAYAYVGESVTSPERYYQNNVAGSLQLLEAMREAGVDKLVFSSTCAVYGVPQRVPIDEGHPVKPINPYGSSKLMVEQILRDSAAAGGPRFMALRYFNAAGADPDGEIGEAHTPETHLIPLVLRAAALGSPTAVTVLGGDYDTADGTCVRDYVHVADLAAAHVAALRRLLGGGSSSYVNVGTGQGYSVREVIKAAKRVTGRPIREILGARREGDPPILVADAARSFSELGWRPRRSAVETQIGDAWRWYQTQHRD